MPDFIEKEKRRRLRAANLDLAFERLSQKRKDRKIKKFKKTAGYIAKGSKIFIKDSVKATGKKFKPSVKKASMLINSQMAEGKALREEERKAFKSESLRLAKQRGKARAKQKFKLEVKDLGGQFLFGK